MKIDIHVHTKKVKQGDAATREIDAKRFSDIVTATEVKIIAITNHNLFDHSQYIAIRNQTADAIQIWPGVELDIIEGTHRGHLIVIVSPNNALAFANAMNSLSVGKPPDSFAITIPEVISNFDNLNPIYIAHYHQKKPDLLEGTIDNLTSMTKNPCRVLKEVTNSISAGIYINHGHSSIHGSDVQDWEQYESLAKGLPELRLPVESFEHFCLLLEKDKTTINTILNRKFTENLVLQPFEDKKELQLNVFNDINVIFGSKGTGKSKILQAIAKYYKTKGITADVFESSHDKLDTLHDIKGNEFYIDFTDHNIDYCTHEIASIKTAVESDITNLSSYRQYFSTDTTNKNAKKISIKDFQYSEEQTAERKFNSLNTTHKKIHDFIDYANSDQTLIDYISKAKFDKLQAILESIIHDLEDHRRNQFVDFKVCKLFNSLITKFKNEIAKKTDTPIKPSSTGFTKYAKNRINIEVCANKIRSNILKKIDSSSECVGSLGRKGFLYCKTEIAIQNGSIIDSQFNSISKITKKPQKEFASKIKEINDNIYNVDLFEKIAALNAVESSESITTIHELALFKRYFTLEDNPYQPSNGEVSMLLLHKELSKDKDVYILDEPEKSLGNDYINDEIVPLIKEKAKKGKKVFISTHDANIAVRTLPYNSIYREHTSDGYETYVGNPFSNNLIGLQSNHKELDWKAVSMKTLEGGKEAFGERGKIYGNV